MQEMGFDPYAYLARFDSLADLLRAGGITSWNWPEEVHRVLWDNWFEREEEFFRGCADLVEKHRSELFTIACRTPLRKPEGFEEAFRAMLPEHLQRELDLDSPRGTPEPVESVWYKLRLMHRNLWLLPDSNDLFRTPEGLKSEPNPLTSALDKHHHSLTWRVSVNGRYHYLTDAEYEFLTAFREPKAVSHEFLDGFSAVDGWSLFIELRNRKLIT